VRATNGQYVHTWQSGSTWAALTSLSTQQYSQPPALWINADGRLEVFGITTSGALAHEWQTSPGGGWSAPSTIGGSMAGPATVTTNSDGRLEVFAAGTDSTLYHAYQFSPASGSPPSAASVAPCTSADRPGGCLSGSRVSTRAAARASR
jgi:hypothetical protein